MTTRTGVRCVLALVFVMSVAKAGTASDAYFHKPIHELEITEGQLPGSTEPQRTNWRYRQLQNAMQPWAWLDSDGEAFVSNDSIAVRAPKGHDVVGTLVLARRDGTGMQKVRFRIAAEEGAEEHRTEFLQASRAHYDGLLRRDIAGAAWFRHQVRETSRELGTTEPESRPARARRFFGTRRGNDMENTFALVSGGRAVSENLQLDRVIPESGRQESNVAIDSITGITVREFDWKPLVAGAEPVHDPLAHLIPEDQHVLLFPTFQDLVDMIDHADEQGTPILRAAEPRAEDAETRAWYQRQLCLPLGQLERAFGGQLVASVAVTGSDPYFRTGTDVAVVFEAKQAEVLLESIQTRMLVARGDVPEAKPVDGEMLGVRFWGVRSPNRVICAYVARLGEAVVVTNSPAQLKRLIQVQEGAIGSLAALPEYTFFRTRYPRGDAEETALLLLSDKTIRRWCGPRWRIATSRRTRAAAVMSEIQASYSERIVHGQISPMTVESKHWLPQADQFTMTPQGVRSPVYGTLAFQTPILEMDVSHVTKEEATFYGRWRDGYQRYWSNFFDPIAVRFHAQADRLATDLTVMPLIGRSEYNQFVDISKGADLGPQDGDPHPGTLVHWVLAINTDSEVLKRYSGMARMFAPQVRIDPLSWVGNAVAVYADGDSFWADLAKVEDPDQIGEFMSENVYRLPVALHVQVSSGLKLTAFLAGLRGFIEQASPGMTVWEIKEYKDRPYVRISPSERAKSRRNTLEKTAIYYAASGESLIVTLNEDVLRRAMDRDEKRQADPPSEAAAPASGNAWIGKNMCLQVDRSFVKVLESLFGENYQHMMQARAWGNLPILNEWKRRFPDQDPVQVHEKLWHRRLVCPGGGNYRWNDRWQTMESSVYGHPGEPQTGPTLPPGLRGVTRGNFGVTFEENGLRARVELIRSSPASNEPG